MGVRAIALRPMLCVWGKMGHSTSSYTKGHYTEYRLIFQFVVLGKIQFVPTYQRQIQTLTRFP